jgi:hypothetical protein
MKTLQIQVSNEAYKRAEKAGLSDPQILRLIRNGGMPALDEAVLQTLSPAQRQTVIDLQPALNGKYLTQKDWIAKFNSQEGEFKGKRMITAPDVYQAGRSGSKDLLASLQDDFGDSWVVSGTRILYNKGDNAEQSCPQFWKYCCKAD